MSYWKSVLAGNAGAIGITAAFAAAVMMASWIKLGFLGPITYGPRAIVPYYWWVALPIVGTLRRASVAAKKKEALIFRVARSQPTLHHLIDATSKIEAGPGSKGRQPSGRYSGF